MQDQRRQNILELIDQQGFLSVAQISDKFSVSEMTARRDLSDLEREGLLRRVHGGAIGASGRSYEPPYRLRTTRNAEAKLAIGRVAAQIVQDGDSIALDVGTTTLEIARALHDKHNLTIVTSSLYVANEIAFGFSLDADVRLVLTGGIVRSGELSMTGHIAEQTYRDLHVDKAFIGIGGVSVEDGLTEYNLEDALVKRWLLKSARQKIVVADGSKIGRTTFAAVGPVSAADTIITDASAPSRVLNTLRQAGIKLIVAGQTQMMDSTKED